MNTMFMNSVNIKTSEPHVLILNLTDKLDLREVKRVLLYQILVFIKHGKTLNVHAITVNSK